MECFHCGHYIQHECVFNKIRLDPSLTKSDLLRIDEILNKEIQNHLNNKTTPQKVDVLKIFLKWLNEDYLKRKSIDSVVCYLFMSIFDIMGNETRKHLQGKTRKETLEYFENLGLKI